MKYLMIFNTVTNTIILLIFLKIILKKYFHISVDRQIFTDKVESITLMRHTSWRGNQWLSATGIFCIPIRRIK